MTRTVRIGTAVLLLALASALAVLPAFASIGRRSAGEAPRIAKPLLVSRADGSSGAPAEAASLDAISADANRIVFSSTPLGTDAEGGLYLRDVLRHTTTRLSGRGGWAALSADGSVLAHSDEGIFVRRLPGGRQRRVAPPRSGELSLSADGDTLAFASSAPGLAPPNEDQVFVRDLRSGGPVQVSRASGAHGALADGESNYPVISADGRFVAFVSHAHNLAGKPETGYVSAVYLRDLATDRTIRVSPRGVLASEPSVSADGSKIVFASAGSIYVFRRQGGKVTTVATGGRDTPDLGPAISADGRYVAYRAGPEIKRLAITSLRTGKSARIAEVGRPESGGGPIALSADGRFIAFDTHTEGLVGPGKNFQESGRVYRIRNPLFPLRR